MLPMISNLNIFCCNIIILSTIIAILALFMIKWLYTVKSESLLLVRNVGLQSYVLYKSGFSASQFIPWNCIHDIVINEVVQFQRVLYILVILVKDYESKKMKIVPLLQEVKPRLKYLEQIYRRVQIILHETQEKNCDVSYPEHDVTDINVNHVQCIISKNSIHFL